MKKRCILFLTVVLAATIVGSVVLNGCSPSGTKGTETTLNTNDTATPLSPETADTGTSAPETETLEITDTEAPPETEPLPPGYVQVTEMSLTFYATDITIGQIRMPLVTMLPEDATDKSEIWTSSDESIATVDEYGNIKGVSIGQCTVTVTSASNPAVSHTVSVNVIPEAPLTYIDGILIVNKTYALPSTYNPGYDNEAFAQLSAMFNDAKQIGYTYWIASGFRSYYDQYTLYNNYVAMDGKEAADRYSARAGHSEHQTGLAFDLNYLTWAFGDSPEGIWLAQNCHKYGFIIRYPKDKEHLTGYMYEPWHVRYLGVEKATAVYESGLCLEEYLGITSVYR